MLLAHISSMRPLAAWRIVGITSVDAGFPAWHWARVQSAPYWKR